MTSTPAPLRNPGRPPAFDRDVALGVALDLLWAGGFKVTPIGDLIARMDLSRSSFYATFGSKRGVLLAAIQFYSERGVADIDAIAQGPGSHRLRLHRMMMAIAKIDDSRGCFMVNCISELARHDDEIRQISATHVDALVAIVAEVLTEGGLGTVAHARAIVATAYGATLFRTAGMDSVIVTDMIEATLKSL